MFEPRPEHKFSFGLWTVSNRGRDPFGDAVRPPLSPVDAVKLLAKVDVGYSGPRHFDAHAYRTEDYSGVEDFARGCMRTYLILKERAAHWNADAEIQSLLQEIVEQGSGASEVSKYSPERARALLSKEFDRAGLAAKDLAYERLDQLTVEVLLGVR